MTAPDATPRTTVDKLRDMICDERKAGNVVFQALPNQFATAPLDEFVRQPVDEILYDLNRGEEVSLTFLKDPKWVNDFAVALVIRKLAAQRDTAESANAQLRAELAGAMRLLEVAKCPACDGSGAVPHQVGDYEWEAQQCQWCFESKAAISAARQEGT